MLEIKVGLEPVDDQVVTGCMGCRLGLAVLSGAALLAITFAGVVGTPRMITWAVARALTIVILVGRVPVN